MKSKLLPLLAIIGSLWAAAYVASAQTPMPTPAPAAQIIIVTNIPNQIPPPNDSFLATAGSYFTTFNTNYAGTFDTGTNGHYHGSLWTGAVLQNNINLGQEIGLSYNVYKNISLEAVTLNAGVFNTILSQEVGVGYNIVLVDTKITGGIMGGLRLSPSHQGYGAGFLMLEKALTTHTFMGLRVELQTGGKTDYIPMLTVMTGFTF